MDSINIMTSLVGLLGSAGKVVVLLLAVKKSIREAPQLMDQMLAQVKELEISFSAVQSFLLGIRSAPKTRISMIRVEQIVATLTEAVLTFSELEALMISISEDDTMSITARLMVHWKQDIVASLMVRLERHKSSLSLMLNIVQCESDQAAEQSRQMLQSLVEQLLTNDHELSRRLRSIEEKLETGSIITNCFRNGNVAESAEDSYNDQFQPEIHPMQHAIIDYSLINQNFKEDSSRSGFYDDLGNSRVYKRTERYESDVSFTTSAIRTHAWSVFSGMSLSEVSLISAIALPLHLDEVSNQEWYMVCEPTNTDSKAVIQTPYRRVLYISPTLTFINGIKSPSNAQVWSKLLRPKHQRHLRSYSEQRTGPFRNRDNATSDGDNPPKRYESPFLRSSGATEERQVTSTSNACDQSPSKPEPIKMDLYKLVMLGDTDSGKEQLRIQFYQQSFDETHNPRFYREPIIDDLYIRKLIIDGESCMLEVLDTTGQEEYTALSWLTDQWIRDGEGFVLTYSITRRSSFTRIRWYHSQISRMKESSAIPVSYLGSPVSGPWRQDCPLVLMLVGNNSDRVFEREVSTQEGRALAKELGCEFVEVSVKNCINVEKPFYDITRQLRRQRIQAREARRQALENQTSAAT